MPEVLVVVDHADGAVKKPTYELLTMARRIGEPSAVFVGPSDQTDNVVERVKKYGAEKVYVIDDVQIKGFLVAPKAEAEGGADRRDPDSPVDRSSRADRRCDRGRGWSWHGRRLRSRRGFR